MGRSNIYIRHSKDFELVSPTRVLNSGYLFLLFYYDGKIGGWRDGQIWGNECSYSYDMEKSCIVVKCPVSNCTFHDNNGWSPDDDPNHLLYSLHEFLKQHSIESTTDSSNIVNLTPKLNNYDNGYRCSGYHLINIPCPFITEDDALDAFNLDAHRWMIESDIMDAKYIEAKKRRKKKGIEKRKATMASKRESKIKAELVKTSIEERKDAISNGMSVGNVRGLSALGDHLVQIWGNDPEYITRRSLVMCDGVDLKRLDPNNYIMPFGKHRGIYLINIKGNYCEWLFGCKVDGIMGKGETPDTLYYNLVKFFGVSDDSYT